MLISLVIVGLVLVTTSGCDNAGTGGGGGGIAIASYPSIPGSVLGATGGGDVSLTSGRIRILAEAYLGQAELLAEYGEFMMVPETGMNYNETMALAFPTFQQWAQDYQSGVGDWRSADPPYDIELDFEFGQVGTFRATKDFTHYEAVLNGDGGERFHYEVRKHATYTHGFMYAYLTSGNAAVDTVDIVSTDDWTFTKVVRIFNLDGTMDGSGKATIDIFAGINRNDGHERVLGVKRHGEYTLPDPLVGPTYVPDSWDDRIGAFDATQLAIRPAERPSNPALWHVGYPDEVRDPPFDSQGETFDSSLFPTESDARLLFDVGINPEDVGQWVINADLSRNYDFPEWDPADISFAGLTP